MNIPAPDYTALGYDRIFVAVDGTPQQELVIQRAIIIAANPRAAHDARGELQAKHRPAAPRDRDGAEDSQG